MSGKPDREWISRINRFFGARCQVVWWGHEEAEVRRVGPWSVPRDLREEAAANRADQARRGKPNETQALCVEPIDFTASRPTIGYRSIDYATARALRAHDLCPGYGVLSASCFLVDVAEEALIVQKRGAGMDLNPGRLHGFAGAYMPGREPDDSDGDGGSLLRTARRELREETGLDLAVLSPAHLVFFSDPNTTALELCLLGVAPEPKDISRLVDTEEGGIVHVRMAELGDLLRHSERWGPGGQCEVMAWLALGAPPFSPGRDFGGRTAKQIFRDLTETAPRG